MNDFMNQEMYLEHILDLYKNPLNFGVLDNADFKERCFNPSCGDEVEIQVRLDNNKVEDVKFIGKGCAISVASASLLTDHIKGKSLDELKNLTKEDMIKLIGIEVGPARVKCVTCSLVSLREGIKSLEDKNVRS
ncbi:MAG: SUF system NifU family Fe-S cluster assembly protein [Candidatus Nanoarchaeia archaeon]|jgi:nitrogen fixation NifU-like protein|nr:SUF system NifU family Fe-S cluster assembly protein [Candidatus Nanoarchaeia archaeon]|tara:strand:+ start:18035 stop:18436 length:402 start_codon:yes stop_codon:yes gene_type:complete